MLNLCNAAMRIFIRKMVRITCLYVVIKVLAMFLIVFVVFFFFVSGDFIVKLRHGIISDSSYAKATLETNDKLKNNANSVLFDSLKCDTIHVGMVVLNSNAIVDFYTVFKSLLFYRNNPLHLHILVDIKTEHILKYLFDSWSISQLNVSYYKSITNNKTIISTLPVLLSNSGIEKIIIIDPDKIFTDNIYKLWTLFDNFGKTQVLGIIDIEDDKSTKRNQILLIKLKNFPTKNLKFLKLRPAATYNTNLYYTVSCPSAAENGNCYDSKKEKALQWNTAFSKNNHLDYSFFLQYDGTLLRGMDGHCGKKANLFDPKKEKVNPNCSDFISQTSSNWRALLFIRDSNFSLVENDVTLVSQLSYDRINMLEELERLWNGPISLALYAADSEMSNILNYIKTNNLLQNRSNIAFHIVFKENKGYPINVLRNTALQNVLTPYVFLLDIDFIPSSNLYTNLRYHLTNIKNTNKKAFIVPAFEAVKNTIPTTKFELLRMLIQKKIAPFHYGTYPAAHEPTNYTNWLLATEPYNVQWKFEYEPYLVVQKNVTPYDTRFFGYGWNKVSHIMELHKQRYQFVVLPNVFIVHKNHEISKEKKKFILTLNYQKCLKELKKDFVKEINRKYKYNYN